MAFLSKIPKILIKKKGNESYSPTKVSRSSENGKHDRNSLSAPSHYVANSRTSMSTTQTSHDGRLYEGPSLDGPIHWLQKCRNHHHYCTDVRHMRYRPTRLVDLGPDFDFSRAKLVESRPHDEHVDYLALSYCWGNTMPEAAKTLVSTLPAHKLRIRRAKLPRTFKHFFEIAKLFGIRYLWIDSLCIIQDSDLDWQQESSSMGDIYSGAVCTIAAESAKDCQGGIWLESRTRAVEEHGQVIHESITQEQNLRNYLSVCDQRLARSPLHKRGWALQERELSVRVLHFTFAHIYWECREQKLDIPVMLSGYEAYVGSPAGRMASSQEWHLAKLRAYDVPIETRNDSNSKAYLATFSIANLLAVWRNTVEDYTSRQFSRWTDRLPALSGLANEFQLYIQNEYLAGIWRDDLKGLLWMVRYDSPSVAVVEYHAPSFSWASVKSPVTYSHLEDAVFPGNYAHMSAQVRHAHIVPEGVDSKGHLLYGAIQLQCTAKWVMSEDDLPPLEGYWTPDNIRGQNEEISRHNPLLIIRILVSQRKGVFCLKLRPGRPGVDEFMRIGMIGGVDNRWFDVGGFSRTVTIV